MVMETDQQPVLVTHITPVDITGIRDAGMQSLILLAASLRWNVVQKVNNPVLLVARDGTQKRLPTNTSIRMSVFQTSLSTIILHTEPHVTATIELIDAIVAKTKPSKDHERRLRLAIGETPTQHRERVQAAEAEAKGAREPLPVTQRLEIPEEAWVSEEQFIKEMTLQDVEPPADGEDHGVLLSIQPFMAAHVTRRGGVTDTYQSESSMERKWADGYVDYECTVCGRPYATPKGVGAHRQAHTKAGDIPKATEPAYKRATVRGTITNRVHEHRRTKAERQAEVIPQASALEFVELPPEEPEEVAARAAADEDDKVNEAIAHALEEAHQEAKEEQFEGSSYARIVNQIAELILPNYQAQHDREVALLKDEIFELRRRLAEVEGEFDALIELATQRRRPST